MLSRRHRTAPGPPPDPRRPLPALSEQRRTLAEEPWRAFHHLPRRPHHLENKQEALKLHIQPNRIIESWQK